MKSHIGETKLNKNNSKMTIISYKNHDDIIIEFEDGYKKEIRYSDFKSGNIKNPNDKIIFNKGFLGEGKYNTIDNQKIYRVWYDIMMRCYNSKIQENHKSYIGCIVCKEWHNFQNFAKWYDNNYYEINKERICVDKDIIKKRNKIYSPNTCILVPERINTLFVTRKENRGDLPIGVGHDKTGKNYISQCTINKIHKNFGTFHTPKEAFNAYKEYKEQYIKQIADEYKNKYPQFPQKVYDAMYNYKIEITD